jgi:GT2 family glycosyltransferase
MTSKTVSIVINCGIREHFLPSVISSLLLQDYEGLITVQLNYFSEKSLLKKYGFYNSFNIHNRNIQINYLTQPEKFFNISYGNNIGAYMSDSDYLLFIPGDMVLSSDFVRRSIEIMSKNDIKVMRHGLHVRIDEDTTAKLIQESQNIKTTININPYKYLTKNFQYTENDIKLIDGILMVERSIFNETGYDEQVLCMEDTEFALRSQIYCRENSCEYDEYPNYRTEVTPCFHLYHYEPVSVHNAYRFMRKKVNVIRNAHENNEKLKSYSVVDINDLDDIEDKARIPITLKIQLYTFRKLRKILKRFGI